MQVTAIETQEDLERYLDFANEVYRDNPYWIAPERHYQLSLISGTALQGSHCRVQPFCVEAEGRIAATVTAVVDDAFNRHWNEKAGHLFFFEALPDRDQAAGALLGAACEWLAAKGCRFARQSFLPTWQLPLTIDAYDCCPTFFHTYNPAYYHRYIKNAGFVTEKGAVEYQVRFDPTLADLYRGMIERATSTGVRLRAWDFARLEEEVTIFGGIYNHTFATHWGAPQFTLEEGIGFIVGLRDLMVPEFTVFTEVDGEAIGAVWAFPDLNQALRGQPVAHGLLLIIGVEEGYRGKGVNLAMAAQSYLAMIERGYHSASYTPVLDDNWPSRRTAEKLGARVARNFVIYRRDLR